jgi:large subunit ribosomal protein L25
VAGDRIRLEVTTRDLQGSRASRRLRKQGLIPGVLYGRGNDPHAIVVPERDLRRALGGPGGLHTILDVVLFGADGGRAHPSVLKDYQVDPVRGGVTHVDLQEVRLDRPIQAQVVVQLVGDAAGTSEGGVLSQPTRELNVEALPMEIPEHIDVDVTEMHIGDTLRLADLPPIEAVTFLDDPDETVLATVTQPTRVEEPEEIVEEGEDVTGVPAGEQAPEGGAEAPLEPGSDASRSPGTAAG